MFKNLMKTENRPLSFTDKNITQREAAIEAVKKIGLNKISDVKKEWFTKEQEYEMFSKRLEILEKSI